jgi:FlaA1/EpsC-like NDP-sugar epimerase
MGAGVSFWSTRRVMVTGGAGFFGSFVTARLRAEAAGEVFVPGSREYDFVDPETALAVGLERTVEWYLAQGRAG